MNELTLFNRRCAARDSELAKMRIGELEDEQFSHHFKSAVLPIGQLHPWKGRGRGVVNVMEHTFQSGCRQGISDIHRRNICCRCAWKRVETRTVLRHTDSFASVGIEGIGRVFLALAVEANKFGARQYGCRLENKRRIGIGGRDGAIKKHRQDGQKPQLEIPHGLDLISTTLLVYALRYSDLG